eukprot:m.48828 g.48828  ORF g.48828 m.48828 type:complete len:71 (+) comp20862_c0_seq1:573-785(+)
MRNNCTEAHVEKGKYPEESVTTRIRTTNAVVVVTLTMVVVVMLAYKQSTLETTDKRASDRYSISAYEPIC